MCRGIEYTHEKKDSAKTHIKRSDTDCVLRPHQQNQAHVDRFILNALFNKIHKRVDHFFFLNISFVWTPGTIYTHTQNIQH